MTKRLRIAIENIIDGKRDFKELKEAYEEHKNSLTVTMQRVEFLEDCLVKGMNKRAAARALVEHDPRIGRRTAETLVYTSFSGMYQNPRKKRSSSLELSIAPIQQVTSPPVSSEEDLL